MKKYIFILSPPYQGSTILYSLLDSSHYTTSFLEVKNIWAGESQWLLKKNGDTNYEKSRWDPNYNLNMNLFNKLFIKYLDPNKKIYVEKSPPTICRAKKYEEYFSKLGEVYFIINIRNPYSVKKKINIEKWISFAKIQKKNIETLNNIIVTSYEEVVNNLDNVIAKIKNKIPELNDITNRYNKNIPGERGEKINKKYINRIIDKESKNKILKQNIDLLNFFFYKIIE